ncbi:MAG: efflux transporter outer membrane subunit [Planctomycetes bacterium]|nr:efflux transporter outer membrane subunit [Planctomycetota bacterium]
MPTGKPVGTTWQAFFRPAVFAALGLAACTASPPPALPPQLDFTVPETFANGSVAAVPGANEPTAEGEFWRDFGVPDLDLYVAAVLAANRDLRAAAARFAAAAQSRAIAAGAAFPEVDAGLDGRRTRQVFVGFPFGGGTPSRTFTTFGLSLNVRWELDVWGRIRANDAAAYADLQAAAADHAAARLSLIGQSCRAWFAAVEAEQQLELAERAAAVAAAARDDVQERFRRGVRPAIDLHQAAAAAANAAAVRLERREVLAAARQQLELLLGQYPAGRHQSPGGLPVPARLTTAVVPPALLERRPDLVAAERRLAAAGCRVEAARAALYPRLSLTASGGTNTGEFDDLLDDDFRVWSLGANLLAPLFRGGALQADVGRAGARADEALANYGAAVLRAFAEAERHLRREQLLAERADELLRAAQHAEQSRAQAYERWQLGVADFLAVADGQQRAYSAAAAALGLARERLETRIDLCLALGGGTPTSNPPAP